MDIPDRRRTKRYGISHQLFNLGVKLNTSSVLSHQAGAVVKQEGKPNDMLQRIQEREFFQPILPELDALTDPATFTGRSVQIVERLVTTKVKAALEKYKEALEKIVDTELKV